MSVREFEDGDRVIISQTPVDGSDRRYSGKVGTVENLSHRNGDMEVYRVMLDESDYAVSFYGQDLLPHDGLEVLRAELAEAEAEVVRLKEAIKAKERDASELPIATVVSYKDAYGPAVATKQSEGIWINIFPTAAGNPNTEFLDDDRVTKLLANNADAVIRKP